jgi:acyl carrier protein
MTEMGTGPFSFDEFRSFLADALLIEEDKITPEASLIADLGVDSLRWAEMALRIYQLGIEVPAEVFWEIQTVGDAYEIYLGHSTAEA